jgi:NADH-quinone oxidoreductase subunit J
MLRHRHLPLEVDANVEHNILDLVLSLIAAGLGALGTYMLLPRSHHRAVPQQSHTLGAILAGLGLTIFAAFWRIPQPLFLTGFFFSVFCVLAIVGAVFTVASRNPVYSALWFASVILSTTGLFLIAEAPFLAAGTVIVYAGAIIVTFLFVIMLAQREGRAVYDRAARAPGRATLVSFLLLWTVCYGLISMPPVPAERTGSEALAHPSAAPIVAHHDLVAKYNLDPEGSTAQVVRSAVPATARLPIPVDPNQPPPHVAGLGGTLFTDHLISVELAGGLLFVALIAAVSIAAPRLPRRPGDRSTAQPDGSPIPREVSS